MKKHYDILINGKKFKIMNYIISSEPYEQIRLITKVKGQCFPRGEEVKIEIHTEDDDITRYGIRTAAFYTLVVENHHYKITNH